MFKRSLGVALPVIFALFIGTSLAIAFSPSGAEFEVPLPEFAPVTPADLAERGANFSASVADIFGGRWHAQGYNTSNGKPRWLYGSGPQVAAGIANKADLRPAARGVLEQMSHAMGLDTKELRLDTAPNAGGKWAAHYQQTYHGVDVWQARVSVVFSAEGNLMAVGNQYRQGIDLDPRPALSAAAAVERAASGLPFATQVDQNGGDPRLLVLPVPVSAWEEEFHLVWRVRILSDDPLGAWVTHVDAHDGSIVWRYNDVRMEYSGATTSTVQEDTYCLGADIQTMPNLRVTGAGLGPVITDADGNWSIAGSGGPIEVTADLYGPYVDLNNWAGGEAVFTGTASDGLPLQVAFDASNSRQDERDVFDGVNDINEFFEAIDPDFAYANQRIQAYVGRTDGYCPGNAWWNGTINFCEAGQGYGNTGEIQNVVQHEFGHGVNDYILGGTQGSTGMGEGNSDILANIISQESIIGLGFYEEDCDSGIRNADNRLSYPGDVINQSIHFAGQVIAGFNWDAMMFLQSILGQEEGTRIAASNWHLGRVLMQPYTMPDQVFATFLADDDDGNLDNGTPHHPYYQQAAANHGFTAPAITVGVQIAHTPLGNTTETGPFDVEATITSTEAALSPGLLKLTWRAGGGAWTETDLAHLGGDQYRGIIPMLAGGEVAYFFSAGDAVGNQTSLPALAPDYSFGFLVAWAIDAAEVDGEWIVGLPDDTAATGIWERVDPVGTIAQPDSDHTPNGVDCWVTGQHIIGQSEGYMDVDSGKTTLTSPVWDLTAFEDAEVRYWRWYSNASGASPASDWWDVMVSNDAGESWAVLEHTMESTSGWESQTFNVTDLFRTPGLLQLRFVAADEGDGSLVEAAVDDLAIIALAATSAVGDEDLHVAMVPVLDQNVPNPFNPSTAISFNLPRAGQASLKIYNVKGELVSVLIDGEVAAGPQRAVWDGTGDNGRPVASGVYFYRLKTEDRTLDKRMLLIK